MSNFWIEHMLHIVNSKAYIMEKKLGLWHKLCQQWWWFLNIWKLKLLLTSVNFWEFILNTGVKMHITLFYFLSKHQQMLFCATKRSKKQLRWRIWQICYHGYWIFWHKCCKNSGQRWKKYSDLLSKSRNTVLQEKILHSIFTWVKVQKY